MRILIVSDTHGRLDNLKQVLVLVKPERILHLGDAIGQEDYIQKLADCPLDIVRGNCDMYSDLPDTKIVEIGGHKIFMTHGHHHAVKYDNRELVRAAEDAGADVALYGHTHIPEISYASGKNGTITVVNPGSISLPRQENYRPSYAMLNADAGGDLRFAICYL